MADYEVRVGDWRIFYRVEGREVQVGLTLMIDGRKFTRSSSASSAALRVKDPS